MIMANSTMQAVKAIGYPECRIVLSQTAIYLATSPKSNASYVAINKAIQLAEQTSHLPVPLHLRNAQTKLMKEMGYGKDYQYAHNFEHNFSQQNYLPDEIKGTKIYEPSNNQREQEIKGNLQKWWKNWYEY
jgi:putative ATPase